MEDLLAGGGLPETGQLPEELGIGQIGESIDSSFEGAASGSEGGVVRVH